MSKWKHCHRWCKRRAVLVPGPTKNHNGVIPPLTRLTKANVPGNSNRPFYVFFFFPTFLRISQRKSVDSAGKSAFSKIVTFESDLLTTNKDIAPQKSPNFRDVCMVGGGHKLAPLPTPTIETSVNFCHFAELYTFVCLRRVTDNWASLLILRRSFQCPRIFPDWSMKSWKNRGRGYSRK